MDHRPHT